MKEDDIRPIGEHGDRSREVPSPIESSDENEGPLFVEASQAERAKRLKSKILMQESERYGEIAEGDQRIQFLRKIYDRISSVLPDLAKGEMHFLRSPEINAFAIRGQADVFMYDGLLRQYVAWCSQNGETPSEDAFAMIVGHELGHVRQGTQEVDPAEEESNKKDEHTHEAIEKAKHEHQSRINDEYDADRFAIQVMARAGYNPREGLKMLQFLQSLSQGTSLPTTHPRSEDRVREITALVESPDTIIQNTDKVPTPLARELLQELSHEDVHRPGTALYRAEAREQLGDFVESAKTLSDVLEVAQVAQMHRYIDQVNHLRQMEEVRTSYAKHIVLDNLAGLLLQLNDVYFDTRYASRTNAWRKSNDILPNNTTRYIMREYGYGKIEEKNKKPYSLEGFNAMREKFESLVDSNLAYIAQVIDDQLREISERISTAADPRLTQYQEKLEYIRDHVDEMVETTDYSRLKDMVTNVELSKNWFDNPDVNAWLQSTSGQDLLNWSGENGTIFFAQLAYPVDEQMRSKIGNAFAVDSRYQAYLPHALLAQEDFLTSGGRSAFLEQSIFAQVQDKWLDFFGFDVHDLGDFLERTAHIPDQLMGQLTQRLQVRYSVFSKSEPLAQAMAQALLFEESNNTSIIESIIDSFSTEELKNWLTSIKPVITEYRASANSLFLNETGLNSFKKSNPEIPDMYTKFYDLERECTNRVIGILESQSPGVSTSLIDSNDLESVLYAEAWDARYYALEQMSSKLAKQSWGAASAQELSTRLNHILHKLDALERNRLFEKIFGNGMIPIANFVNVLEYSIQACWPYARKLLDEHWSEFERETSEEQRFAILKRLYRYQPGILNIEGEFQNKIGVDYLNLSYNLHGESGFTDGLIMLGKGGFISEAEFSARGPSKPLFSNPEIQVLVESLSDPSILRISVSCKECYVQNSFFTYIRDRVLKIYGATFDLTRTPEFEFDTTQPFREVFEGLGKYLMSWDLDWALNACKEAYQKSPEDVVTEGLSQYYLPIQRSVVRTGASFEGFAINRSLDNYAHQYDPKAQPFYEQRKYMGSARCQVIEAYVKKSDFIHDRTKSAEERIDMVVDLIPEKTNYRDVLFADIEADWLDEQGLEARGQYIIIGDNVENRKGVAQSLYEFYVRAISEMVDQARMQLWGNRAESVYKQYLAPKVTTVSGEILRLEQLFPSASFARDEHLLALGNTDLVKTPEQARQIQGLLSEMQRQTHDADDLTMQSQLERFNVVMAYLSRAEKKDFILWTIGAVDTPPKTLRAYGGLNKVSFEAIPAVVFGASAQEREQFLFRLFVGSNGLFDTQNSEDQAVLDEFIDQSFNQIFPDDENFGVVGPPREILRTVFTTVLNEYEPYRRGKIFIGMLESLREHQAGGRGEKIVTFMAELGPIFVKVGQVLSETETSPGQYLLPDDIRVEMKKLKQSTKQFHRLAAVFSLETANEFNPKNRNRIVEVQETLAAASIKQVNAVVRADGVSAVEKILRPSVEKHLQEDSRVLGVIVEKLRAITSVPRGIEKVGETYIKEEADFAREVSNTKKIDTALGQYRENAVVRKMPVRTTKVFSHSKTHIQEERVRGLSLEEITKLAEKPKSISALAKRYGLTPNEQEFYRGMADRVGDIRLQAFDALAFQYFQADAFHADPHAGNIFVTPDGALVLIDNGSIGETKTRDRDNLKKFFLSFAFGRSNELRVAMKAFAQGISDTHLDEVIEMSKSNSLSQAEKMKAILVTVTEHSTRLNPAFDKFLKSFATGSYLMSGLESADVRAIVGAYTQGKAGSLRSRVATSVARATRTVRGILGGGSKGGK